MSYGAMNAYKKIRKISETPRETEARVLTQGAIKLKKCIDAWEEKGGRRSLNEALTYNKKIWTLFQMELSKNTNAQPMDIKNNLLSLSVFVNRQIRSAMIEPSPEILNSIININMSIAQGLGNTPRQRDVNDIERVTL